MTTNSQDLNPFKEFKYLTSYNIIQEVQCGICRLDLPHDKRIGTADVPDELFVTSTIYCNTISQHEAPINTHFAVMDMYRNSFVWDYNLTYPIKVRDLPYNAMITFTVWTAEKTIFGSTSMRLFNAQKLLKQGKQKLVLHLTQPSENHPTKMTSIGEDYDKYLEVDLKFKYEKLQEEFLNIISANTPNPDGVNTNNQWINKLTYSKLQSAIDSSYLNSSPHKSNKWGNSQLEQELLSHCYLIVNLPKANHPIIFQEKLYPSVTPNLMIPNVAMLELGIAKENEKNQIEFNLSMINASPYLGQILSSVVDWEIGENNPAEELYRRLAHDTLRSNTVEPSLKPNLQEKKHIEKIINAPGDHLNNTERDLLYKFRYSLTENKRALIKFLLSIDWNVPSEVEEVPNLLKRWRDLAPMDVSDALRLLGRGRAFQSPVVREYAVEILQRASDKELLSFLLQLVQALRYEPALTNYADNDTNIIGNHALALALSQSLSSTNSKSFSTARNGHSNSNSSSKSPSISSSSSFHSNYDLSNTSLDNTSTPLILTPTLPTGSPLANFLILRAGSSSSVASYLYWYLKVELEDEKLKQLFQNVFDSFVLYLASTNDQTKAIISELTSLDEYITSIADCQRTARLDKGKKEQKEILIRQLLSSDKLKTLPKNFKSLPNPLNPSIRLLSIVPESTFLFKSTCYPAVIQFQILQNKEKDNINEPDMPHSSSLSIIGDDTNNTIINKIEDGTEEDEENVEEEEDDIEFEYFRNYEKDSNGGSLLSRFTGSSGSGKKSLAATKKSGLRDDNNDKEKNFELVTKNPIPVTSAATGIRSSEKYVAPSPVAVAATTPRDGSDTTSTKSTTPTPTASTSTSTTYRVVFKSGDDLRQDQLVMQMIALMDTLLKKVNLDLRLLTYSVLATGQRDGLLEFVSDCSPIQAILDAHKGQIINFLRLYNADPTGPSGITALAMDNFVRSCAGSCVVTYILAVGDRHLDNIMVTTQGRLFHIDFGFIFGADPKPYPAVFRFTREMADVMGGEEGKNFKLFQSYCCKAFTWLRKSTNLILNLLNLMSDAGIPNLSFNPSAVLGRIEERFRLDLTDEQAETYFIGLIKESLNAIAPRLMELAHRIAVATK